MHADERRFQQFWKTELNPCGCLLHAGLFISAHTVERNTFINFIQHKNAERMQVHFHTLPCNWAELTGTNFTNDEKSRLISANAAFAATGAHQS